MSRSGHQFMPFVLDKFGNVLEETKEMMYRMLLRKLLMIGMISLSARLDSSLQGNSDFGWKELPVRWLKPKLCVLSTDLVCGVYWAMVLVRVKVAVGNCSGIVENLTTRKGGFFVLKTISMHQHTIDLTRDKCEGMSKRVGSGGSSSEYACPD